MDLRDGSAYWSTRDGIGEVFPPLGRDVTVDVVVVGAGITGALVSAELQRRGLEVCVLDRRDVGTGSTAASTALLQYEIDELLVDLTERFGAKVATEAYRECARGIGLVEQATLDAGTPSAFHRSPSVFVAVSRADTVVLQRECAARADAGFDVRWLDREELMDRWSIAGAGAIESALGGSVDPYALCHATLAAAAGRGALVHDRTAVTGVRATSRRVVVDTSRGHTVTAKWLVVATGYEVEPLLPGLGLRLHTTYAFVSEPVPGLEARYPDGLLVWDHDEPYLYGRTTDDGRMLIGGADDAHNDPRRRRRALPAKLGRLHRAALRRLGLDLEVAYGWAGTFAETVDGLAYIGGHQSFPRTQFALGFGGNGITYSAVAAKYIAAAITGDGDEPRARLFRLDR